MTPFKINSKLSLKNSVKSIYSVKISTVFPFFKTHFEKKFRLQKKKKKKGEEEEEPRDAREAEMMEHDRAIDKNISELKQQAVAMNKELDRQNKQIEVTKQHAKYNAARIRGVNRGAEDILDGGGNQK